MTTLETGPAEKLAELLENAPPQARREITAWLLGVHRPPVPAGLPWLPSLDEPQQRLDPSTEVERVRQLASSLPAGADSQVVTLRLPAERHATLRDWCATHGFSMAAVVRGLVERFLEEQAARPAH